MLKVHFLNVGHGDCTVIDFPPPSNRLSVIDVNRSTQIDSQSFEEILSESYGSNSDMKKLIYKMGITTYGTLLNEAQYNVALTDPVDYISSLANDRSVFRFISTHPHMDHLSGLNALFEDVGITNLWVFDNDFEPDLGKLNEVEKEDWSLYTKLRSNSVIGVKVVRPLEGAQADYYQQDGIHILAPNSEIISKSSNPNDTSYVLLVEYGNHKIVLGGDAEKTTWDYLVRHYPRTLSNVTLLKASHHGRDTGYHHEAAKLMNPNCTIVSVGKKPENDASQKYNQYSNEVLSTRWFGTITFELDENGTGSYYTQCERN